MQGMKIRDVVPGEILATCVFYTIRDTSLFAPRILRSLRLSCNHLSHLRHLSLFGVFFFSSRIYCHRFPVPHPFSSCAEACAVLSKHLPS